MIRYIINTILIVNNNIINYLYDTQIERHLGLNLINTYFEIHSAVYLYITQVSKTGYV